MGVDTSAPPPAPPLRDPELSVAARLYLLCLDDQRGAPARRCIATIAAGIGGALLLDAVLEDALTIVDDRVRVGSRAPSSPTIAEVVDRVRSSRKERKPKWVVERAGRDGAVRRVADELAGAGVLQREESRVLGIFPRVRHRPADPATAAALRARTAALLCGELAPDRAGERELLAASLTAPVDAVRLLLPKAAEKAAKERAAALADGGDVARLVGDVVQEAQAAVVAATTAAVAAGVTSSSNG